MFPEKLLSNARRLRAFQSSAAAKKLLIALAALCCLCVTFIYAPDIIVNGTCWTLCFPLTAIYLLSIHMLIVPLLDRLNLLRSAFLLGLLLIALLVRVSLLEYRSKDYLVYLSSWLRTAREMPGLSALGTTVGNYNAPYFYLLTAVAKLAGKHDLYYLKLISVVFDYVAAYYVMRLTSLTSRRIPIRVAAFLGTLLLPTVLLNSSYWGQCDVIYAALCLGGLLFGLTKRSRLCVLFFALAFSFKLQSIFLFPMLGVFLLCGKVRWRDLWILPAVFFLTLVPALIAGRPFLETVSIYWEQIQLNVTLSMNAPTVFGFFPRGTENLPSIAASGVLFSGGMALGLVFYLWQRRSVLTPDAYLTAALLFAIMIPFFLPYMHERYFFAADVLGVWYLLRYPGRFYVPLSIEFCSACRYIAFLTDTVPETPQAPFSLLMLLTLCLSAYLFIRDTEAAASRAAIPQNGPLSA